MLSTRWSFSQQCTKNLFIYFIIWSASFQYSYRPNTMVISQFSSSSFLSYSSSPIKSITFSFNCLLYTPHIPRHVFLCLLYSYTEATALLLLLPFPTIHLSDACPCSKQQLHPQTCEGIGVWAK